MPRIRYLHPDFFSDEDLGLLPYETRLTYAGLWCYADREGRLEDRPKFLKAMLFPYNDISIEEQLDILANPKNSGKPFIQRYQADGKALIQIIEWDKYQHPHHTERESGIPPYKPPLKNKDKIKIKIKIKEHEVNPRLNNGEVTVKERLSDKDFELLWKIYPQRHGKKVGKKECLDYFLQAISREEFPSLMVAVENYAVSKDAIEGYAKDPIRFLKKDRWKDWIEPPEKTLPKHHSGLKAWAQEIIEEENQDGREGQKAISFNPNDPGRSI